MLKYSILLSSFLIASNANAYEVVKPEFDDRKWVLGFTLDAEAAKNGKIGAEQYVLETETMQNWSELVTVNSMPGLNILQPYNFEQSSKKEIGKICTGQKDRTWSYNMSECGNLPSQSEIVRAFSTDAGFYVLHYSTRNLPISPENKEKWTQVLQKTTVEKIY